ncbi:hypothetical protein L596_017872 [Steinernema carpocapsae]|uniref:Uncharacterized protein n=1 Tax=Steinernema carpocapsae TaxID=34508 RepID=A0A4V6A1V0_STECR|nr:hypothetical protein L596_017872 [Steinernema carpocapsae]
MARSRKRDIGFTAAYRIVFAIREALNLEFAWLQRDAAREPAVAFRRIMTIGLARKRAADIGTCKLC